MSRKVLILANVGNNDVSYEGEREDSPAGKGDGAVPARAMGEWLFGIYEDVVEDVVLPIIPKGIEYVESLKYKYEEVGGRGREAPSVELFCTDQRPPHPKDTIAFAKIIQKKLPELFPNEKGRILRLRDGDPVDINSSEQYNPSRYDDMYSFFEGVFERKASDWRPDESLCFVFTSGGTPAMNMALILHAVRHFGDSCVQIYVPDRGGASELRVGEEMVRAEVENRFNESLASFQFRSAAGMLESTGRGSHQAFACRYAEHRLAFDFRQAVDRCRDAIRMAHGEPKRFLEDHERRVGHLAQGGADLDNRALLIEELFYNLEVKYEVGEFVDVLGRLFRLQEALLGWAVQSETDIKTDEDKKIEKEETQSINGLTDYVAEKLSHGPKVNRYSLTMVTGYLVKPEAGLSEERREWVAKVRKSANKINKLANLRNNTIIAHSFEGVSERDIIRVHGSETLIEDLKTSVGDALGRDLSTNPFFELADRLRF